MNSVSKISFLDSLPTSKDSATGSWRLSYERQPEQTFFLSHSMAKVAGAGLAFLLAVSPITIMQDPWLQERRRRDDVVTVSIYQEVIGRFVSRSEALQIAQQILEQAERERLEIAESEAARGIQWGN